MSYGAGVNNGIGVNIISVPSFLAGPSSTPTPPSESILLMETGDWILMETGDAILLES
jgi:hypothetical protein